jgi:hypothetical protein
VKDFSNDKPANPLLSKINNMVSKNTENTGQARKFGKKVPFGACPLFLLYKETQILQGELTFFLKCGKKYSSGEPAMIRLEEPELAGLMGVKGRVTPSKGGSLTVLNLISPHFGKFHIIIVRPDVPIVR